MKTVTKVLLIVLSLLFGIVFVVGGYTGYKIKRPYKANYTRQEYQEMYPDLQFSQIDNNTLKIVSITLREGNQTGIVFYPGAMVESDAYIPLMARLAQDGFTCYIEDVPENLAILALNQAKKTIEEEKQIAHWYVAGHSMGGMVAMRFAKQHSDLVDGVIAFAAATYFNLKDTNLTLLSIYGDRDSVMGNSYENHKKNNPNKTIAWVIKGGNHAQFGDYGEQLKDGKAAISPEAQRKEATDMVVRFCQTN